MAYFLRKEKKKKGTYLQMYESFWDKDRKQPRTRNVKSFGYVEDLISDEIPDPIKFYSDYIKEQNENRTKALSEESRPRAFSAPVELNIGHFLLYSLIDELYVKETIDILASQMRFQFSVFDLITQLIYARVISPCSKSKTASHVFPYLYGSSTISEDQVYDGCPFLGESYKKYIDLFNHSYDLIDFIHDFMVVNKGDNTYINISRDRSVNEKVKKPVGFSNLDALHLSKAEVDNFFQNYMLLDT